MRAALLLTGAATLSVALAGCERSVLPVPRLGPHTGDRADVVPYPPPPARVEIVPPQPKEPPGQVWVDGEWRWKAGRWVWEAGDWETPAPNGYYAPPTTLRLADGTLEYFAGAWHAP